MTFAPQPTRRTLGDIPLGVTRYDRVAGMLVSLLILIGCSVGLMFVIWLTSRFVFLPKSVPVKLMENVSGRGDHAAGYERDFEAPGIEEMPELAEPLLEASLEAVTENVSRTLASLDVLDTAATATTAANRGRGDNRPEGPLGEGDDIVPRWARWEVRWTSTSVESYARQLDFFGIELGAAGRKPSLEYAFNLSRNRPDRRSGPPTNESRLYMTWRSGTLVEFDRALLRQAGIDPTDRVLLQFYPEEAENRLAVLEMEHARGRGVKDFLKTVFGVRPSGRGFELFVMEQRFRS